MRGSWKRTGLLTLALFLSLVLPGATAFGQGNGKGGGKPPKDDPPADPIVIYQITNLGNLNGGSINTAAVEVQDNGSSYIVGTAFDPSIGLDVAYVYMPGVGISDLNLLGDLFDPAAPLDYWVAEVATDINKFGQIVGRAIRDDGAQRPFVFDLNTSAFTLIPVDVSNSGNHFRFGINDSGSIVCSDGSNVYVQAADPSIASWTPLGGPTLLRSASLVSHCRISNSGVIAHTGDGGTYLDGAFFADVTMGPSGLNEFGDFAGETADLLPHPRQTQRDVVRYRDGEGLETIVSEPKVSNSVQAINDQGDVLFNGSQLYIDAGLPEPLVLSIDDVVDGSAGDLDLWNLTRRINAIGPADNPTGTGFPILYGQIGAYSSPAYPDGNLVLLTPQLP